MGDVGQKLSLDLARPLHRLGHAVERGPEHADLVVASDAHAPRVVAGGDVLGGARELGQRACDRAADQEDEEHRDHQRGAARLQQARGEVARGAGGDERLGLRQDDDGRPQRVDPLPGQLHRRGEVVLVAQAGARLEHVGEPRRLGQLDPRAQRLAVGAVVHDVPLAVEEQQAATPEARRAGVQPFPKDLGRRRPAAAGGHGNVGREALLEPHGGRRRGDLAVQLVLDRLVLQVADLDPGEEAGQEQADGDDARGRSEEAKAQGQLPTSSSR